MQTIDAHPFLMPELAYTNATHKHIALAVIFPVTLSRNPDFSPLRHRLFQAINKPNAI